MEFYNEKNRVLYVLQDLLENTDETHSLNSSALLEKLRERGIYAERKSIYSYIDSLRDHGFDICVEGKPRCGYYLNSRFFDIAELKLLIDAVQASRFISVKKSRELTDKLCKMSSCYDARNLREELYVVDRVKASNEHIFYSVDVIHRAMIDNKKISFTYHRWNMKKELEAMHGGSRFVVSPWLLVWEDGNYYMIAFDDISKSIKYYRVDKMRKASIGTEDRLGQKEYADFNPKHFAKRTFNMWGEETKNVEIECENSHVGIILDRFGKDPILIPCDNNRFRVRLNLCVSEHFYGWIVSLGGIVRIVGPDEVVKDFKQYLSSLL